MNFFKGHNFFKAACLTVSIFTVLACQTKSREVTSEKVSSINNSVDSTFQKTVDDILYLADNISVDSARKQFNLISLDSLQNFKERAKYHYANAYLLDYEGEFEKSIDTYKKGIQLIEENGDLGNEDLPILYNDMAYVYGELQIQPLERVSYGKAFQYIEKYHPDDLDNYSSIFMNYMQALSDYGDRRKATEVRETAKSRLKGVKKTLNGYRFYLGDANYLRSFPISNEIERVRKDFEDFQSGLSQYEKERFSNYAFYTLDALGYGLLRLKDYESAERVFTQMKGIAKTNLNKMKAESNLAATYLKRKQYLKAENTLKQSFSYLSESPLEINGLMLLTARSQALSRGGLQQKATGLLTKMWENYLGDKLHSHKLQNIEFSQNSNRWLYILYTSAEVFRRDFENSGDEESLKLAGIFAQKSSQMFSGYYAKGIYDEELNEHFKAVSNELLQYQTLSNSDFKESISILNQIENNRSSYVWNKFLNRQFDQQGSSFEDFASLQYALSTTETEQDRQNLWNKKFELIENLNPTWADLIRKEIDVSEIAQTLQGQQSILRYLFTENELWVYQLRNGDIKVINLGDRETIENEIKAFYKAVSLRNEEYKTLGEGLFSNLIEPLNLTNSDVTIVPDGLLSQLPFEALGSKPLIHNLNISYLDDLRFYRIPEAIQKQKSEILALAPDYKSTDGYMELKSTFQEAEGLQEIYKATVLKGKQATKANFLRNSPEYTVLHMAMHASLDSSEYHNSALVFDDGGQLTFDEISALQIPAKLVVLSACNTGNGKQLPGEGLMSLSRALTLAGSRSLLHTLWEIPDTESAEIMSNFYQNLSEGRDKKEALTEAKRKFINDNPLKTHPWYWAGYVLNGEKESLELKRKGVDKAWIILLAVTLLITGYFILKRSSSALSRKGKSI
ncbi:CHAT domain-containing protein [Jiulongibacter sp. NS-SX5]|uniref:CHAT domain-containing protein n=1 Tax=Jiulongibacter sp. NS-SX5 TaxID=3463854 RepID=UPI004059495E